MARTILIGDAVFWATIGFLSGILAASFGWNLLEVGTLGVIAVIAVAIFFGEASVFAPEFAVTAVIILATFFFGASYYHFFETRHAAETKLPAGKGATFSAIITDEPDVTAKYILLEAQLEKPYAGAITIFAPLSSAGDFRYGDEVRMTSIIEPPQTPGDTPAAFPKKLTLVAEHRGFWLREDLLDFKAAVLEKFDEALPSGDEAALLSGETLGGTDDMSAALKDEMSASGTSYITAMYGYKIFVIAAFVEAVLANFVSRRMRFFAALGNVALFVVMAGGGASVVRGAIMGSLGLIAKHAGRISNTRNSLAFTATAMALWDPTIVAQAVFLLSFLSVIGMAYLAGPIENFFGWGSVTRANDAGSGAASILDWREAIVIAAASLLPIIPTIVVSFGDFSLSSFPSNALIALPLPVVTFFGFVLAIVGFALPSFISRWLMFFIAPFASIILRYQLAVIKIFAAIIIPLPAWFDSPLMFAIYFAALIWFAWAYQ